MNTAEKIIKLMEDNGISAYKLSKDLGIAQSSISSWRTGSGNSYMKYIQQLADYFKVPISYLLKTDDTHERTELEGVYFRFAKEAQELGLDEDDMENILNIYRKHKQKNQ